MIIGAIIIAIGGIALSVIFGMDSSETEIQNNISEEVMVDQTNEAGGRNLSLDLVDAVSLSEP